MQNYRPFFNKIYSAVILLLAFAFVLPLCVSAATKKKFTVVIDAGHGGNDFGAIENGLNEKDINLAVALKLGDLIKKKLKDTEVIYTRSTDKFISLQQRADLANGHKADLFISIHCNSVDRSNKNRANVQGATTYILGHHKDADNLAVEKRENSVVELDSNDKAIFSSYDPSDSESNIIYEMAQKKNFQNSARFANAVQKEMTTAGRVSRGVQQAGFWVLWSTAMPAALIELDFLCNPEQAKFLGNKEGQEKLAGAIFNAVKSYESYYRKSTGTALESSDSKSKNLASKSTSVEEVTTVEVVEESVSEPVIAEATEIPVQSAPAERRHRAKSTQSAAAKSTSSASTGSHRRRSSSARRKSADQVEETTIAMATEHTGTVVQDAPQQEAKPAKKDAPVKENAKEKDKKKSKAAEAKPGRREKSRTSGRKAVKQNVNVKYKILLFASDDELKANDELFKGLSPVSSFRENNKYNYTYGESDEYSEMDALLKEIDELFPDARVIKRYQ